MRAQLRKADLPAAWGALASELLKRRTGLTASPTAWRAPRRGELTTRVDRRTFSYVDNGDQAPFISWADCVLCCRPHWEWNISGADDRTDRHASDCWAQEKKNLPSGGRCSGGLRDTEPALTKDRID
jgi:hypothetical protein